MDAEWEEYSYINEKMPLFRPVLMAGNVSFAQSVTTRSRFHTLRCTVQ
ncbi:hypothetical protein L21SP2_3019 [Salinispira pacifica]|uniref:Uncharacterized protein n=1 Tax=Salinispira pacifica TaxID=1307761 RepID=V5WKT7_9SPIO|nr:hypothetical protein L21SP2_3019 [Salinispira pacifica]